MEEKWACRSRSGGEGAGFGKGGVEKMSYPDSRSKNISVTEASGRAAGGKTKKKQANRCKPYATPRTVLYT